MLALKPPKKIINALTESASRSQLKDAETLYDLLKLELEKLFNLLISL
jgi:fused signal recognition particle receptor